jgi:protein-tyrosine kinase
MSQIKKALEKAKKERELFSAWEHAAPVEASRGDQQDSTIIGSLPDEIGTLESDDITPPIYSQTRVVQVDRDRLINGRVFSILEKDRVADQYKLLRTMILNMTRPLKLNSIEVTSFKEREGKSLTCVNLAISLAKETRQTVLLVDMDLRRPTLHQILGIDASPGLKDYFLDGVPLKDILVHPEIETLTVLPAGGRIDNSTEIIGSHRMENLVEELKSRYQDRYILFDTPALDRCPDALVLSSYVDGIVLVARANYTTNEDVTAGMSLLKDKKVFGTVLNEGDLRKAWTY